MIPMAAPRPAYEDRSCILPRRDKLEIIIVGIGEGPELLDPFEFFLHILGLEIEHYPFGIRVLALDFVPGRGALTSSPP